MRITWNHFTTRKAPSTLGELLFYWFRGKSANVQKNKQTSNYLLVLMCSGFSSHLDDCFSAVFVKHLLPISRAASAKMAKITECVMSLFKKIISSLAGGAVHGILMNRFPLRHRHWVPLTAPHSGVPLPDVCNVPVPRRTSDSDSAGEKKLPRIYPHFPPN